MATNSTADETTDGFTDDERAAMKERAKEVRGKKAKVDPLQDLLEKIAALPDDDRLLAERVHAIVTEVAPALSPKTWYGMPAWAKDGKVVVFVQPASKFKARYATLGFNDDATLDDGDIWATSFAVTQVTPAVEQQIRELVARAAD
ncbi:iron chaperone [Cellulomonas fimi]|uniref:YdhG-like domain-containing protein n=1 Tax=Cellulomonas fimi (strain ATCC 484 / DSM 20113 / JCM 1341 / CCUG 24087 / LMG 16345 / NBRC 15513 / NCIMB 8980 / NCTC 7547 / NRS-133) TaxID=590998 RepID=F4H8M2_CELFA|nr:hypothetical protein [Cellulomonas fimi]AEE47030.1 Domain of unknown function DUF1801 [Cellulomonas fimi ATCC 484]NNH07773.1 hypothetical protein [Cellulomonas fimi]VEH34904.1 Uncharacterized conserved protein [Cellulomonas fimi]